jgi:hypothetical protein
MVSACAPGLGTTLPVQPLPDLPVKDFKDMYSGPIRAQVAPFIDNRLNDVIAQIENRSVRTAGNPGIEVQQAFERQLKSAGIELSLLDSPTINGEITRWRCTVTPGFPSSTVTASAEIRVRVNDLTDNLIYLASYSGETEAKSPILTQDKIQETLSEAMAHAVNEAVKDEHLVEKLIP